MKRFSGYDMGPIRIPPLPQYLVLTDRDDGTEWLVTYNTTEPSDDDLGYISITDEIPTTPDKTIYAAYEEPFFRYDDGRLTRLIIRGGYLGAETLTEEDVSDHENARLMVRKGLNNSLRELILSETEIGEYAWVVVEL